MATNKIPTHPQRVRVFLRGGILAEGEVHVKAGAYRQRVSDMLNLQAAPFLALTNVSYQAPGASPMHTEALLVHIPDIVAVDLFGTSADGTAMDAAPGMVSSLAPPPGPGTTAVVPPATATVAGSPPPPPSGSSL